MSDTPSPAESSPPPRVMVSRTAAKVSLALWISLLALMCSLAAALVLWNSERQSQHVELASARAIQEEVNALTQGHERTVREATQLRERLERAEQQLAAIAAQPPRAGMGEAEQQHFADLIAQVQLLNGEIVRLSQSTQQLQREVQTAQAQSRVPQWLALARLERAIAGGRPFRPEFAVFAALTAEDPALRPLIEPLETQADNGVPSIGVLQARFAELSAAWRDPLPENATWWQRTRATVSRWVRVQRLHPDATDTSPRAQLSRVREAVVSGDLPRALALTDTADAAVQTHLAAWLSAARGAVMAQGALDEAYRVLLEAQSSQAPPP